MNKEPYTSSLQRESYISTSSKGSYATTHVVNGYDVEQKKLDGKKRARSFLTLFQQQPQEKEKEKEKGKEKESESEQEREEEEEEGLNDEDDEGISNQEIFGHQHQRIRRSISLPEELSSISSDPYQYKQLLQNHTKLEPESQSKKSNSLTRTISMSNLNTFCFGKLSSFPKAESLMSLSPEAQQRIKSVSERHINFSRKKLLLLARSNAIKDRNRKYSKRLPYFRDYEEKKHILNSFFRESRDEELDCFPTMLFDAGFTGVTFDDTDGKMEMGRFHTYGDLRAIRSIQQISASQRIQKCEERRNFAKIKKEQFLRRAMERKREGIEFPPRHPIVFEHSAHSRSTSNKTNATRISYASELDEEENLKGSNQIDIQRFNFVDVSIKRRNSFSMINEIKILSKAKTEDDQKDQISTDIPSLLKDFHQRRRSFSVLEWAVTEDNNNNGIEEPPPKRKQKRKHRKTKSKEIEYSENDIFHETELTTLTEMKKCRNEKEEKEKEEKEKREKKVKKDKSEMTEEELRERRERKLRRKREREERERNGISEKEWQEEKRKRRERRARRRAKILKTSKLVTRSLIDLTSTEQELEPFPGLPGANDQLYIFSDDEVTTIRRSNSLPLKSVEELMALAVIKPASEVIDEFAQEPSKNWRRELDETIKSEQNDDHPSDLPMSESKRKWKLAHNRNSQSSISSLSEYAASFTKTNPLFDIANINFSATSKDQEQRFRNRFSIISQKDLELALL